MDRRSIATLVGCATLSLALGACDRSADGPSGVDSCDDLADMYVALHQQAVDDVERADPAIPTASMVARTVSDSTGYSTSSVVWTGLRGSATSLSGGSNWVADRRT